MNPSNPNDPAKYGDRYAEFYDLLESPSLDTEGAVQCIAELAEGTGSSPSGPVLELGVGTGRVALPLAATGLPVHGIEASQAMLAKLRKKEGGPELKVFVSDFREVKVDGSYALIFAAYNTFSALRDQESQVHCLTQAAKKLQPGGLIVLECSVPDTGRLDKSQDVQVRFVDADLLVLHASRYDTLTQGIVGQSIIVANGTIHTVPAAARYVWPSELDLMAQLAGLKRVERWSGWRKQPFLVDSKSHVSVYALDG